MWTQSYTNTTRTHLSKDTEKIALRLVQFDLERLYGDGSVWVRPLKMWNETVVRDGKEYKRFTFIE